MLQPRICRPTKAIEPPLASLIASLYALSLRPRPLHSTFIQTTTFVRHASHASQGRANGPKDSAGRRLGAKKSASEYVIPGNIIFKQRGTKWFPGENVDMGKDHTIFATVAGYVRYYKDPTLHPKRRYVGVALEREGRLSVLPTPRNAASRRRLGMYAAPIKEDDKSFLEQHLSANSKGSLDAPKPAAPTPTPMMKRGTVMAPEANFGIGRTAEKKGITVREFDRGDRWLAWRKRAQKTRKVALIKAANATRKTKEKKANKGAKGATGPVKRR